MPNSTVVNHSCTHGNLQKLPLRYQGIFKTGVFKMPHNVATIAATPIKVYMF